MGGFSIRPTGQQQMGQREVDALIVEMRMAPKKAPPPLLGIRQIRMMREKNNGYPKDMYHPELESRRVLSEEEEAALAGIGYTETYEHKQYPRYLHRRNMEPKFEPHFDPATNNLTNEPFVETRLVRNEAEEKALQAMKPHKGQSAWCAAVGNLPDIDGGPDEDPNVTIARLQGQLSAFGLTAAPAADPEPRRAPGRPRKAEDIEA